MYGGRLSAKDCPILVILRYQLNRTADMAFWITTGVYEAPVCSAKLNPRFTDPKCLDQ